jgi:hypothetical protein
MQTLGVPECPANIPERLRQLGSFPDRSQTLRRVTLLLCH